MTTRLPHEKGFHISWDQLHRDSRALAWRLDGRGPEDGAWKAVVAITRGGMAPAMIVARELDIRLVDTISIRSYQHQTQSEGFREEDHASQCGQHGYKKLNESRAGCRMVS